MAPRKLLRYSNHFILVFLILLLCVYFAFRMSSENRVTLEKCEKLSFPVLKIETEKGREIKSKEKYLKADFSLDIPENSFFLREAENTNTGSAALESGDGGYAYAAERNGGKTGVKNGKCKIRGHGNSTWKTTFTQKKPYLLKLEESESLLGLAPARKWILIADATDRSMLRNYYAEYLARNVWNRMRWNPSSRFITLFVNGKYRGVYSLTEKVEVEKNRVEFSGEGFLAEIDSHAGRPYSFSVPSGAKFHIRSPKSTLENYERWAEKIRSLENLLFSAGWKDGGGYRKYFDTGSFVDWYLLSEYSKNYDANFYNSVFMNYDYATEKLYMGPAWDHDIAFGNTSKDSISQSGNSWNTGRDWGYFRSWSREDNSTAAKNHEGFLINQRGWYKRLFEDEDFAREVRERWLGTRKKLGESIVWLKAQGVLLNETAEMNDSVWHLLGSESWPRAPGYKKRKTYRSEVEFLVEWCEKRIEWLDSVFGAPET